MCVFFSGFYSNILQARVNVPALSVRTIQGDIAASSFTIKAGVQVISMYMSSWVKYYYAGDNSLCRVQS